MPRSSLMHYQDIAFGTFHEAPGPEGGHIHDSVEMSVFEGASALVLYGGKAVRVPANRLLVHWGMLPHRVVEGGRHLKVAGVHLPLAWVLDWALPANLVSRLLNLEFVVESRRSFPCSDLALMASWHALHQQIGEGALPVIQAEAQARLHRMALLGQETQGGWSCGSPPGPFHRALREIAQNFTLPIRMEVVARNAGLSVRHLSRLLRQQTGFSFQNYVDHLRITHATRLLTTTDRKIIDVMLSSGFSCATRFYEVFRERTGTTPRDFRQSRSVYK